jgi:hypothetical protein
LEVVQLLHTLGANPLKLVIISILQFNKDDKKDKENRTCLWDAIYRDKVNEILPFLLSFGVDINHRDFNGNTVKNEYIYEILLLRYFLVLFYPRNTI